jgi:hypothetical protein
VQQLDNISAPKILPTWLQNRLQKKEKSAFLQADFFENCIDVYGVGISFSDGNRVPRFLLRAAG